jgi:DNA polymerase-3 subunit gamma/tau
VVPAPAAPQPAATAVAVAEPPPLTVPATLGEVLAIWPAVLEAVKESNSLLSACLGSAQPVELRDSELIVAFGLEQGFMRRQADDAGARGTLVDAIRQVTGTPLRVTFELRDISAQAASMPPPTEEEWIARLKAEFDAHEVVPDEEP